MTTEKMERLNKAIHDYTTTTRAVSQICAEYDVRPGDLYDELDIQGLPRRGYAHGIEFYKPKLTKEEVIQAVRDITAGKTTAHQIAKEKGTYRSTVHRAIADTIIACVKDGEDIRKWLK